MFGTEIGYKPDIIRSLLIKLHKHAITNPNIYKKKEQKKNSSYEKEETVGTKLSCFRSQARVDRRNRELPRIERKPFHSLSRRCTITVGQLDLPYR
jgi:hypothetical protein